MLGFLYFCSSGIILASATIINPLMLQDASLGMNATMLGTGFSLFVLVQGLSAPLIGALISRCGARFSMALGAVILLASMLALIFVVASAPAYFVVFGIIASAATMMVGQLAVQSTIGNWFVARRGVAMTCMMVIGASASFVAPPAANAIIGLTGGGWRSGWYLAAVILAVGTVVGAVASSRAMLFIFYGCIGLGFGGVNAVFPTAMANYFGAGSLSKNLGVGIMVTTLVASALPIMSGAFFDATGSCALAFYVTAGIVAACAVCGMLVIIPKERG